MESGVRIQPLEGQVTERRREFQVGQFELSQEAGLIVQQNALEAEPIHVKVGGNVAYRMYMPEDGLEFRHDLNRDTIAHIQLNDALYVLERGVISKSWPGISFRDAIDYVISHRDDPNDVITGVRILDDGIKEAMEGKLLTSINSGFATGDKVDVVYDSLRIGFSEPVASFDFQNITPLRALNRITGAAEIDAWVDPEGTLLIGLQEGWGEVIEVLDTNELQKLANYTVTEASSNTKRLTVTGAWTESAAGTDAQIQAVATRNDVDTGANREAETKPIESMASMERIATIALIKKSMEEVAGTIEFDGFLMSNDQKKAAARMRVGDHIVVDGSIPNRCEGYGVEFNGGHFNVQNLSHRWNPREGWRFIVSVAEIPEDISTRSWVYNPASGTRYEEDDVYGGIQVAQNNPLQDAIEDAFGALVD